MDSSPGLGASTVSFSFGRTEVVSGFSLSMLPGQSVALTGPNGSGKTTILKMLSGTLRPSRGGVYLDGKDLASFGSREIARRIAVVPQHIDPNLSLTVEEIVGFGRTPYAGFLGSMSPVGRHAVADAMALTGVSALHGKRFSELSGGEQQRVTLAMAIAQSTDYLLLDEPTLHLDLHHQHVLLELLQELRLTRSLCVLAVMHDLNLAALYFDSIVVLNRGVKVIAGPPKDIFSNAAAMQVFGAPLHTITHPQTGVPQVLLRRGRRDD